MARNYIYHDAIAMLLDFEQFIVATYGLHTKPADGKAVILNPLAGSLVEQYRLAVRNQNQVNNRSTEGNSLPNDTH
jgi:hypothetical protein